jgi:hypothetical protein
MAYEYKETKSNNGKKVGRPRAIPLDITMPENHLEAIEKMARTGNSPSNIRDFLKISEATWHRSEGYSEAFHSGVCALKNDLLTMQMTSAKNGSVPMQIFLGKNFLGQAERSKQEVTQDIKVQQSQVVKDLMDVMSQRD